MQPGARGRFRIEYGKAIWISEDTIRIGEVFGWRRAKIREIKQKRYASEAYCQMERQLEKAAILLHFLTTHNLNKVFEIIRCKFIQNKVGNTVRNLYYAVQQNLIKISLFHIIFSKNVKKTLSFTVQKVQHVWFTNIYINLYI